MLWWVTLLVTCHFTNGLTSRSHSGGRSNKQFVYVGGLFSNASQVFGPIQNAIKDINHNPSILGNYLLQFIFSETDEACDLSSGFQTYLDFVDTLPRKHLLMNGLCTEMIRLIDRESRTPHGNPRILQVSYANSNPSLDSTFQSSLFRLFPAETQFNPPRTQILEEISVSIHDRIGLIYQNTPLYSGAHVDQVNQLMQKSFLRLESEGFEDSAKDFELRAILRRLLEKKVMVVLGNFEARRARQILCLAYKEGMDQKWILAGNYEPTWWHWRQNGECTTKEMERVMDGMIRMDILPYLGNAVDTKADDHYSFHQSLKNSKVDGYIYDALWAMAYALNEVPYHFAKLNRSPVPSSNDDFITNNSISFQSSVWDEALQLALASVTFQGVTVYLDGVKPKAEILKLYFTGLQGPVSFDRKQGRLGYLLLIKQFQSTSTGYDEVNIGEYDSLTNNINLAKFPHRMITRKSQVLASKSNFEKPSAHQEFADEASKNIDRPASAGSILKAVARTTAVFTIIFQHRLATMLG